MRKQPFPVQPIVGYKKDMVTINKVDMVIGYCLSCAMVTNMINQ